MAITMTSFVALWLLFDGQYFKSFLLLMAVAGTPHG